ncbi:hypothetical protein C7293_24840 [filamentous cyanobacterium CCT1]|nr:hypothetical protein C7293_24840 [filamentous cyanobacterium CCT1]PSN76300.1 hypothetical protein C8B47_28055 [filamentous cyanobacterium CCP4]
MLSDLRLLSLEEQWKLMSYLVNWLRPGVLGADQTQPEIPPGKNAADIDAILQATQGCWGNSSVEEIDANLHQQRQLDWQPQDVG